MNLPDSRGWAAIGLFVTFGAMVALLAFVPDLAKNQTFDNLTVLVAGAVLKVGSFYFGASKDGDQNGGRGTLG